MCAPFVHQARLQEPAGDKVRCLTCERRCLLADGQVGWCRTRENRAGTLYTLIYGAVSSLSCNPIEKKPLYHFYPGSVALTAGSYSCNFACPWCQNWDISKQPPSDGEFIPPREFVARAQQRGCRGTSISFNEPTLSLEWSLELFPLAREAGLYNTFVTNGYMTTAALELLVEAGLDGTRESPVQGDLRSYLGSRLATSWDRKLGDHSALRAGVEVLENLEDTHDLRVNGSVGLEVAITSKVALKTSCEVRYDREPQQKLFDNPSGGPPAVFTYRSTDTVFSTSFLLKF